MLTRFSIKNIVLIENCEIEFIEGLNVLTGETGAGKSVILSSLSLLLGERFDTSMLRQGQECGAIIATFATDPTSPICSLLKDAGIEHSADEELIIRREILSNGKTRASVNSQPTQLYLIKKIAPHLIESCGQHAHMRLTEKSAPLEFLDTWADLGSLKKEFQQALEEEKKITQTLIELRSSARERERLMEHYTQENEKIDSACLKEGQEEELFGAFSLFADQKKNSEVIQEILTLLDGEKYSLLSTCAKSRSYFEKLTLVDPKLEAIKTSFEHAHEELRELCFQLDQYNNSRNFSPDEYEKIEKRLQEIYLIKRAYGSTIQEIFQRKKENQEKITSLISQDVLFEELQVKLPQCAEKTDALARNLSKQRALHAPIFAKKLTSELQQLNMPHAVLTVAITQIDRTESGDEEVRFMLIPNRGEKEIDIQNTASGGELARLMLALQVILIDKQTVPTILFDEIDANIGGETARMIGEKLKLLAKSRQVICITHFPQLAVQAERHFRIYKFEKEKRTVSTIELLHSQKQRSQEITRMLGGQSLDLAYNH